MRKPTLLEDALACDVELACLKKEEAPVPMVQAHLDTIASRVCDDVGDDALVTHMRDIYNETAQVYAGNTDHGQVPDHLHEFMKRFTWGKRILDIGSGTGRDALFMSVLPDEDRARMMTRMKNGLTAFERYRVPMIRLNVLGIDQSSNMVAYAQKWAKQYPRHPEIRSEFMAFDMHELRVYDHGNCYDGVWSSAALFMHTPPSLISRSLEGARHVLVLGGILTVSYANNNTRAPYHNLRYSRTGEVKYFSRPTPALIRAHADVHGLDLLEESYSDLTMGSEVKKDFFITQTFVKQ